MPNLKIFQNQLLNFKFSKILHIQNLNIQNFKHAMFFSQVTKFHNFRLAKFQNFEIEKFQRF